MLLSEMVCVIDLLKLLMVNLMRVTWGPGIPCTPDCPTCPWSPVSPDRPGGPGAPSWPEEPWRIQSTLHIIYR